MTYSEENDFPIMHSSYALCKKRV